MLKFALPCLFLLAGCTMSAQESAREQAADARDAARLEKALVGREAGKPESCINPMNATNLSIYGETLVYKDGRTFWVNKPLGGCFGLKRDDIVVTRSYGSQLCRGDIVRTIDRTGGFPTGACSFGDFVPYRKPRG
jgi:hypothetical protein